MNDLSFEQLHLSPSIQKALNDLQYRTPTPIQARAIPSLMEGRDLIGIAQTGTGKTAAFAIPILERLSKKARAPWPGNARILILTPTRELASQIDAAFADYSRYMKISRALVYGGVGQTPQVRALSRGVDVLTATPGRLLDLMNQGHIRLDRLEVFVLDEADRMLDMGFLPDIRRVVAQLPAGRQTLLFSATMPAEIASLAAGLLHDPIRVDVAPPSTPVEKIEQKVHFVVKADKRRLLVDLLRRDGIRRALVFTRTKHGANRLARELDHEGVRTAALHGDKSQSAREEALGRFRAGRVRVLVATDIAARGLDVEGISHVINFDIPNEPENYIHRIGRTARAGADGAAISFCDADERPYWRDIERLIRRTIEVDADHPYHSEHVARTHPGETPSSPRRGAQGSRPPRNRSSQRSYGSRSSGRSSDFHDRRPAARSDSAVHAHSRSTDAGHAATGHAAAPDATASAARSSEGGRRRRRSRRARATVGTAS